MGQDSHVSFIQSYEPALNDGDYQIQIEHKVNSQKLHDKVANFTIQGPRFAIESRDIYSCYPPQNGQGDFHNCLPHIILTRKSLPWERSLDVTQKEEIPWLALISFSEDELGDLPGESQNKQVKDLKSEHEPFHPSINLETGQSWEDQCKIVDLPADLLNKILPTRSDLPYLAHLRVVDQKDSEFANEQGKSWFSCMICNRIPKTTPKGCKNYVHLVSLEGFGQYIKDDQVVLPKGQQVRLVSLADWSFYGVHEEKASFGDVADDLDGDLLQLRIEQQAEQLSDAEKIVERMLEQGYSIHNHILRNGEETASWYRGPLVPLALAKGEQYQCIESSDQGLRYDSRIGLFDTSYAAAWQIGRLLALQNNHFANELYKYRKETKEMHRLSYNLEVISDSLELERGYRMFGATSEDHLTPHDHLFKMIHEDLIKGIMTCLTDDSQEENLPLGSLADSRGQAVHRKKLTLLNREEE